MTVEWSPIKRRGKFERKLLGDNTSVIITVKINADPHPEWLALFEESGSKFYTDEDPRRSPSHVINFDTEVAQVEGDIQELDALLGACNEKFRTAVVPRLEAELADAKAADAAAAQRRAKAEAELDRLAEDLDAGDGSDAGDRPGKVIRPPRRTE